jgi:hypothetical protein
MAPAPRSGAGRKQRGRGGGGEEDGDGDVVTPAAATVDAGLKAEVAQFMGQLGLSTAHSGDGFDDRDFRPAVKKKGGDGEDSQLRYVSDACGLCQRHAHSMHG